MIWQGIAFDNRLSPATSDELDRFEAAYGISLPGDYREFLLNVGGGSPAPSHVFRLHSDADAQSPTPELESHLRMGDNRRLTTSQRDQLRRMLLTVDAIELPAKLVLFLDFSADYPSVPTLYSIVRNVTPPWRWRFLPIAASSVGHVWLDLSLQHIYVDIEMLDSDDLKTSPDFSEPIPPKENLVARSFTDLFGQLTTEEYRNPRLVPLDIDEADLIAYLRGKWQP